MNSVKTVVLLGLLGGAFVAVGWWLGGPTGALIALGFAAALNGFMYWSSDKLALRAARARPLAPGELPQVEATVRSLTQRLGMPMPALYVIETPQPNAFATGRNPRHAAVAVTRGIVELMTPQELEGVLAHELAHVANRDILIATIAATIGAAVSFLSRMAFWGSMGRRRDDNGIGLVVGLITMILAPLVAVIVQMAISRTREFQADRSGAEITGAPLNLASALRKLEVGTSRIPMQVDPAVSQLFIADPLKALGPSRRGGGIARLFSTHPPIAERIERLEAMASPIG